VPPLRNPRHEKFVQGLLEGKSALDAYEDAGYRADDANSSRLRSNPKVQERLAELQAEIASETKVTTESLIAELEYARGRADSLEQLSAAVRAIESKAKLSGLLVERKQVEIGGPGSFDHLNTGEEIFAAVVDEITRYALNGYHDYTSEDRQRLIEIYLRAGEEADAYIEAIKARPYRTNYHQPKSLPSPHNGKVRQ
jgi:crotonobetainyl-CoA:carnitine CoA-transferase CaiB-like acyl-CoA transferase